jgi:hypothetical protein
LIGDIAKLSDHRTLHHQGIHPGRIFHQAIKKFSLSAMASEITGVKDAFIAGFHQQSVGIECRVVHKIRGYAKGANFKPPPRPVELKFKWQLFRPIEQSGRGNQCR